MNSSPSGFDKLGYTETDALLLIAKVRREKEKERGFQALQLWFSQQLWFSHKSKVTAIRPVRHFKVCRDENDDMFLDAAYAGKAKYIISWDKDLLAIEEFRGTKIVNPGEFLEIYERGRD
ncbi:MAG: putative toxin-antitoxin system toxin component, PIN family [Candidatus Poribacteria bacterium]